MSGRIKVLIVDDSALVRETLKSIVETDPELEVMALASDPYDAVRKMKMGTPDVVCLDIEMPKMDGITFLKKLMAQHPIPVIVISTLTVKGTEHALKAMEYGALEVMAKPKVNTKEVLEMSTLRLTTAIKSAAQAKVKRYIVPSRSGVVSGSADVFKVQTGIPQAALVPTDHVIAIGASTGGTEAIRDILKKMPLDCPGIVIVQHMPEMFTEQFANRLNEQCGIRVKEAKHRDVVHRGEALIAPGDKHMVLRQRGPHFWVHVQDGPTVNRHKPSVDVLFNSVAKAAGKKATGLLLTGMGRDGAQGLLQMKEAGADTIAQDESTSIVYGMPREAMKLGAANHILPLDRIASQLLE